MSSRGKKKHHNKPILFPVPPVEDSNHPYWQKCREVGWDMLTAIHESGHALVWIALGHTSRIKEMRLSDNPNDTTKPWGIVDTYGDFIDIEDSEVLPFIKKILVRVMSGKVATELIFDIPTPPSVINCDIGQFLRMSNSAGITDDIVKNMINTAEVNSREFLSKNIDNLMKLAGALYSRRRLTSSEINELVPIESLVN